jgi:hypothetical protein
VIGKSAPKLNNVRIYFGDSAKLMNKGTVISCHLTVYSYQIQAIMLSKIRFLTQVQDPLSDQFPSPNLAQKKETEIEHPPQICMFTNLIL